MILGDWGGVDIRGGRRITGLPNFTSSRAGLGDLGRMAFCRAGGDGGSW